MSQRNPIKSEFYTFTVNTDTPQKSDQSSEGGQFYAVNVSGSREVIFTASTVGWFVTNQPYNEVIDATQPAIREKAQLMPLPYSSLTDIGGQSTPLVTHSNDDMLYVLLNPEAELKGLSRCFVWVIR